MSKNFNQDQDIAEKRVDLGIKEEDKAPLRDRIVKKLFEDLEERKIGQHVTEMWSQVCADKDEWLQRQREFLNDWDEFMSVEPQGIFESSSNLHIPVSLWVAKAYHARFLQTILTPEPAITIKARKSAHSNLAPCVEDLVKYALTEWCNNRNGIEETLDQWLWSWITTGIGVTKWRWDAKFRKYIDVVERMVPGPIRYILDPATGVEIPIPTKRIEEEESVIVDKVYEGPICDFVNFEDVGIVSEDITDINNADAVIHRQWLTASELWTLAERKIFDFDAVEDVIETGDDNKSGSLNSDIKLDRQVRSGESSLDKNYDLKRYEILEAYLSTDVDDTGINSDIVVWVHAGTGKLLRATYLHRINKTGERPIQVITFHKRSGNNSHLPIGLIEIIHPLVKEIDAMHNMRVDFGLVSTVPFGFYRSSSSLNPKDLKLEPGVMYPLDNPQTDVYFPQLGNRTSFGYQEEQMLFTMIERLTGISDLSLGVLSGSQGATRTATGARILQQEVGINLDVPLKRLNRGWKKSLEYLLHMIQQRIPQGFEYRVTGEDYLDKYKQVLNPNEISGDYDIEISPSASSSNKQIQFDNSMQLMQITQNPLDIQLGIVTPQNRYEAIKNFMKTLGIKEISRYINSQFDNLVTLTPKEELDRVAFGMSVPVLPTSDHDGVIGLGQQLMSEGRFTNEQTLLVKTHLDKHAQMKQAMAAAAAQQANAQQISMNRNLAMSQPSAPEVQPTAPMAPNVNPINI